MSIVDGQFNSLVRAIGLMEGLTSKSVVWRLELASGYEMFKRLVRGEKAYQEYRKLIEDESVYFKAIPGLRIGYLARQRGDEQYAHPHDIGIAICLMLLMEGKEWEEVPASEVVEESLEGVTGLFWAKKVAAEIMNVVQ